MALVLSLITGIVGATSVSAQTSETSVGGSVTEFDATPVVGVQVDLFETAADGSRGAFLSAVNTGDDGMFRFPVDPGCYTTVAIAPDGRTFRSSRWLQASTCVAVGEQVELIPAVLDVIPDAAIGGKVTLESGDPAEGVVIDLFLQNDSGDRGSYLGSTSTGADGVYEFDVAAGCYVLTMIASDGLAFESGAYYQPSTCTDGGGPVDDLDAVLLGSPPGDSGLGGQVTDGTGAPASGVEITLWESGADGSRAAYIGTVVTGDDGRFSALLEPDCYWLVYIAPAGETFNGGQYLEKFQCLEPGQIVDDLDAMLDPRTAEVSIRVANARGPEGSAADSNTIEAVLTLSGPAPTDLSVDVRTSNGSAQAGQDYEAIPAGTQLAIPAGTTTLAVPVTILGDDIDEADETFTVRLSNPSAGLTISDGIGQITIVDDDDPVVGNPPSIDAQRFSVEEFSSVGTVIGTVVATSNSGGTLVYSLDDSSVVAIDPATGALTVFSPLDLQPDTTIELVATVDDGESASAAITIDVTRISLLPNPNQATTTNGGTLEIEITAPADRTNTPAGPLLIEGLAGLDGTSGAASVTYVVDVSGSTTNSRGNDCDGDGVADGPGDNFNPDVDSLAGTVLDCEIAGLLALNRSLADFNVEVSLVVFGNSAATADVSPAEGDQIFTSPVADEDGNGIADIEEALTGIGRGATTRFTRKTVGTGTDFSDALTAGIAAMSERQAGRDGFLFFLSDGQGSVSAADVQQVADAGLTTNTYSVGISGDGCGPTSDLQEIADGTGGTCTEVDDPGALTAALTESPENIESVVVSIDGAEAVPATLNPLGQWSVEVPELAQGRHVVRATVRATDGTEVAAEILSLRFD